MRTEKYIRQRITEIQENYLKMIPESRTWLEKVEFAVSYTHLTLPTILRV